MPADDLSGISGLDDRRRDVLAQKLEISTCYELIMADRQRIVDAFGRRTIKPTIEEVSEWQDEARRVRAASIDASASATAASGWQSAATFVVAFEERGQGESVERRIVAEQTEVEPEASPQQRSQWPGWACGDICRWMLERVGGPVSEPVLGLARAAAPAGAKPPAAVPAEAGPPEGGPAETGGTADHAAARLVPIDIERASLTGAAGSGSDMVVNSSPVPQGRFTWSRPARLTVVLGPGPSGLQTSVVLQLARPDGAKQNIAGRLDEAGHVAEVDLSGLADGEYTPAIVASTRDGSFLPRIVRLPTIEVTGAAADPGGLP
jgi:hypothetical protein